MADAADRAAELQQQLNESALERRIPPQMFPPSLICGQCGERNDRPAYRVCSECLDQNLNSGSL